MTFLKSTWIILRTIWRGLSPDVRAIQSPPDAHKATYRWAKAILGYADVHATIRGHVDPNEFAGRPVMVMCNHSSMYDIPLCMLAFKGRIRMLAKAELGRIPAVGYIMRKAYTVFVDRNQPKKALKQLRDATASMQDVPLWCAPEGTRSVDGQLLPFKSGVFLMAASTNAIILPVVIQGAQHIMPKGSYCIYSGKQVTITLGTPVDTQPYGIKGLRQLMADVHEQMAGILAAR